MLYARDASRLTSSRAPFTTGAIRPFDARRNMLDAVIRTERLEDDLAEILLRAGYPSDQVAQWRSGWATLDRANTSQRAPAAHYRTPETIAAIAERERLLIDKYGYSPPEVGARQASDATVAG